MSESLSVETRSRSRSKTPFLRSQCDHENCTITEDGQHVHLHEKKKTSIAPKVKRISEEKEIKSTKQQTTVPVVPKTSDYSSGDDISFEKTNNVQKSTVKVSSSTSTVVTRTSTQKSISSNNTFLSNEHLSETITSPIRPENVTEIRKKDSKIKTSTPINIKKTANVRTTMSADSSSSSEINISDSQHLAYQEYHDAGDYWNKTRKTDYTYSKLSPHRRFLKQGEIAMPNMSRRSLEQHHERVNMMISRNPEQEEYIRRRYEQIDYARLKKNRENNYAYDSHDDLDVIESNYRKRYTRNNNYKYNVYSESSESWMMRWITRIVNIFYNFASIFISSKDERYMYSNRVPEQKSVISKVFTSISNVFVEIFRKFYMMISYVLYYDTYLLRSSNPENRLKKRFLLLLLLLLPLLLLTGVYYYLYPTEPFPPVSFSDIALNLPDLELPQLPEISMNYEELKNEAFENFDNLKSWMDDYFLYLKTVSKNIGNEAKNIFNENF